MKMADDNEFVIATYRDVAAQFGLGGPAAARVKAKRAGWEQIPPNHELDTRRIKVPKGLWDQAAADRPVTEEGAPAISEVRDRARSRRHRSRSNNYNALQDHLATLRQQLAAAEQRVETERAEKAALIERIGELTRVLDERLAERAAPRKRRWWRLRRRFGPE